MLRVVAKAPNRYFLGNAIGYELINEPWGTDEKLFSLFAQAGKRIREHDPGAILFIPTHTLVTDGTREDALDRPDFTNMAYSPHYYNGSVLLLQIEEYAMVCHIKGSGETVVSLSR